MAYKYVQNPASDCPLKQMVVFVEGVGVEINVIRRGMFLTHRQTRKRTGTSLFACGNGTVPLARPE